MAVTSKLTPSPLPLVRMPLPSRSSTMGVTLNKALTCAEVITAISAVSNAAYCAVVMARISTASSPGICAVVKPAISAVVKVRAWAVVKATI